MIPSENHNQRQKKEYQTTSLNNTDNNNNNTSVSSANLSSSTRSEQQVEALINDPNFKFPLENSWAFWFYKNEKSKQWKENVKFITNVDFVEDFWGLFNLHFLIYFFFKILIFFLSSVYNHLQLVSKLTPGCDYMFFKVRFH
jgi:hypothetical protein